MSVTSFPRFALCALAAGGLLGFPAQSQAFLGLFKKEEAKVPQSQGERQVQNSQSDSMLASARAEHQAGNVSKARDIYDSILKQFPFSSAAPEAAYAKALIVREHGKLQDAFDAFQRLVKDYRSSPRFSDAIAQQYEIAEEAKGGKKQRTKILIPMKLTSDDVIELYRTIINNAPFGKFAPMAQFSIAEIYQDRGNKNESITAYQGVVDNYPNTKEASEAQFRIGAISNIAAQRSEDTSNLRAARDALTTYVASNPTGERAGEAEQLRTQINSEEAAESLKIGKFYEKQGKTRAAAIYYGEALKFGNAEASGEARQLLGRLAQLDPEAMRTVAGQPKQDFTVPASVDLRGRDDYVGPMSPELAKLSEKPRMRSDSSDFLPIPLQEPKLPTRPGATSAPGIGGLLPPIENAPPVPVLPVNLPSDALMPGAAEPVPPSPTPAPSAQPLPTLPALPPPPPPSSAAPKPVVPPPPAPAPETPAAPAAPESPAN